MTYKSFDTAKDKTIDYNKNGHKDDDIRSNSNEDYYAMGFEDKNKDSNFGNK